MDIDAAWAVVAGVLIAIAGPFVTGHFERRARRDERIEIDQRDVLRTLPDEMSEYLLAAGFAAGMMTDQPGPDFPPADPNARVREKSAAVIRLLHRVRDDDARDAVERFQAAVGGLLDTTDQVELDSAYGRARVAHSEAQDAVGSVYRKL